MYLIKRSAKEIDDVLNKAAQGVEKGTRWPGLSYEEGVQSALTWAVGDSDNNPMED